MCTLLFSIYINYSFLSSSLVLLCLVLQVVGCSFSTCKFILINTYCCVVVVVVLDFFKL